MDRGIGNTTSDSCVSLSDALMKRQQADGRYQKRYLTIVCGVPETEHFCVEAPIGPLPGSTYQRTVRSDGACA